MRSEPKRTLRQLNAFNREHQDEYRVNKLLDGVFHGIRDSQDYLRSAKEVIQNQNAVAIPVQLETFEEEIEKGKKGKTILWRYHLLKMDKMRDKESSVITNYLFKNEQEIIYSVKPTGNHKSDRANEIKISDRSEEELYLDFDKDPQIDNTIYLKANDYQIRMQEKALITLNKNPESHHTPLLRLFDLPIKSNRYFEENYDLNLAENIDFKILNNTNIDGATEQQEFVKKALASRDFALLEGPPGSGKTTAIIELIIQCVLQGQRVLLVSSTHVAVDNVIDRIIGKYKKHTEGLVSPMRIASSPGVIRKESVEPYHLKQLIKHTKKEMLSNLNKKQDSIGIKALKESLNSKDSSSNFDQIILDSANLVGGTAIGILQHPGIKSGVGKPFDVMIVDEASKVTFLDFLVPALHAKKWILVGDVNQLSPYTEGDIVTEHLNKLLDKDQQNLIAETFELQKDLKLRNKEKVVNVLFTKRDQEHFSNLKESNLEVFHLDAQKSSLSTNSGHWLLNSVDVIIAQPSIENETLLAQHLKFKAKFYGNSPKNALLIHHQNHCHKVKNGRKTWINNYSYKLDKDQNWGELVGRSLEQMYQYRFEPELEKNKKIEYDILVPSSIEQRVEGLRRVALPSILELLQIGVGEKDRTTKDGKTYNVEKILYSGFDNMTKVKELKFQSLSYQHRMEDDIARYSREHFYDGNNLVTANTVLQIRDNPLREYNKSENSVMWMPNGYQIKYNNKGKQRITNPEEVNHIKQELISFHAFAKARSEQVYEVAVLSFYNDQVAKLKEMLKELTKQYRKNKFFTLGNIKITLCTVDKFQGDEADMVLLSFAKATAGAHYNSPNRLNVAITRARYKLVLFGNPERLKKGAGLPALQKMATEINTRLTSHKSRN
ncbi:ATP-binding protein [uncultured Nonlabens sp.]|uniref:DEAD/DEAH box helicase n=1 Tax=uncultured Nonlabens sp. TaxID=859306 RepID=UPI00260F69E3|nr:AAA domain-containing protein [uncultured Nonlabens sp.]